MVRNYYRRPDDLEPGQLIYLCPAADERQRKGKTMAHTRLVPVRLTVVAQADIDAMVAGIGALERRELRLRRLTHEAYDQGGVLSEADLSLVTGYTDGGVCADGDPVAQTWRDPADPRLRRRHGILADP